MRHTTTLFIIGILICSFIVLTTVFSSENPAPVRAQDGSLLSSEVITIEAEDGLPLVGEFWAVEADEPAPAILMTQWRRGTRQDWELLVEPLHTAGYNLLAIDMRGMGETGGEEDPEMAISDAHLWLNWLSEQPSVQSNALVAMGSLQGANIAIISCIENANCVASVAFSPVLSGGPASGNHEAVDLLATLRDIGSINSHSSLVIDQRSPANFQDMNRISDLLCCNFELNLQIYPSNHGYLPDGIHMIEAHMDTALPLILLWLDSHTATENIGLDEFVVSQLMMVTNSDPRSPLDTALEAGSTTDFDLAIEECCYFIVEVETAALWSVSPSDGAIIDSQTGELSIDATVPVRTRYTVSVDVENGRRTLSATITVTDIASNPLIGEWHETGQLSCDTGEVVEVSERIGELIFEANGDISVTWFPFEVYVDYIGTYEFSQSGSLALFGQRLNYFPPDFDGAGTFSIDDEGNLILQDIWLGVPPGSSGNALNCGHVFARR